MACPWLRLYDEWQLPFANNAVGRNLVLRQVEPEEAVSRCGARTMEISSCFDAEAELARVRYQFLGTRGTVVGARYEKVGNAPRQEPSE